MHERGERKSSTGDTTKKKKKPKYSTSGEEARLIRGKETSLFTEEKVLRAEAWLALLDFGALGEDQKITMKPRWGGSCTDESGPLGLLVLGSCQGRARGSIT